MGKVQKSVVDGG